jgi:hypothetical protein
MSARNSRTAKAARRLARQPRELDRDAIAAAVHAGVQSLDGHDPVRGCVQYAAIGAPVLTTVTGRDWYPVAGASEAGTGKGLGDPEGEYCYTWRPDVGGVAELHAWCTDGTGIADFHLRHRPASAARAGVEWRRGGWPDYFWGMPADAARLRLSYQPQEAATRYMYGWLDDRGYLASITAATRLAIRLVMT